MSTPHFSRWLMEPNGSRIISSTYQNKGITTHYRSYRGLGKLLTGMAVLGAVVVGIWGVVL